VTHQDGSSLSDLLALLARLTEVGASFRLREARPGALMVEVAVPGERWEIEFFDDRPVEVERFRSSGSIASFESLFELWSYFEE